MTTTGLDKGCQTVLRATVHIDPKTSKEEIGRFGEFIRALDVKSSPVLEFWCYYFKKRDEVRHILRLNLVDTTLLEVAELDELWEDAESFKPILAVIIPVGHLQVETPDLAVVYFGNLPAYGLEFVLTSSRQTNRRFLGPTDERPRQPVPTHEKET